MDLNLNETEFLKDGSGPLWSPDGKTFLFTSEISGNAVPYIADGKGAVIDTLDQLNPLLVIADWSENNLILFDADYWDLESDEFYSFDFPAQNYLNLFAMLWGATNDEIIIIDNEYGLGNFNIGAEQFDFGKSNCSGKYYAQVVVSKDSKYIASVVRKMSVRRNDTIVISPQIRVMDIDGSNEHIVNILRE